MTLQAIEDMESSVIVPYKFQDNYWFFHAVELWWRLLSPLDWLDEGGYWESGYVVPLLKTALFHFILSETNEDGVTYK